MFERHWLLVIFWYNFFSCMNKRFYPSSHFVLFLPQNTILDSCWSCWENRSAGLQKKIKYWTEPLSLSMHVYYHYQSIFAHSLSFLYASFFHKLTIFHCKFHYVNHFSPAVAVVDEPPWPYHARKVSRSKYWK